MPDFAMPAWEPPCFRASESRLLRGTGLMVACGVLLISTAPATAIAQGVCNRTPQVRDKLVEEAGVSQCENVTSEHLARVTSIHLVDVSALRPGDFEGLTSLGSLFFPRNSLSSLPPEVFSGLTSLKLLSLTGSRLTSLPEDVFGGLTLLQNLYLSQNQLTSLPDGIFSDLTSLRYLDLWQNRLTSLPEDVFSGLTSLQNLIMFGNRLTSLPKDVFSDLTSLEILELQDNQLTSLPEGVFSRLALLWWLRLGANQLTSLSKGVFSGLTSLRALELGGSRLTSLPEDVFSDLTSLGTLELGGDQITSLPEGIFRPLTSLTRLYLYESQLTSLPENIFSGLTSLERLELQGNQLTSLPEDLFSDLISLEILELQHNQLTSLQEGVFSRLALVYWLRLDGNRLTSLPKDLFSNMNSLRYLYLEDNQLTSLPGGILDDVLDTLAGPGPYHDYGELVLDNELKARLAVALPDQTATPGSTVTIAVTLSRALPLSLHVPYSVSGTRNDHAGGLLFPAGETGQEITLILSDRAPEVTLGDFSEIGLRRSDGTGTDAPYLEAESLLLQPHEQDAEPDPEDPSKFSSADLAGQGLTLDAARLDGTREEFALLFRKGNRFEQIRQSSGGAVATDSRFGHYDYEHTEPHVGILTLAYDDGESCTIEITFRSATSGMSAYSCSGGRSGSGSFQLRVEDIFVPVVLSSAGLNNSFFTSEMTLTNRGTREATLDYTYTAHDGKGNGTASEVIPVGRQRIVPNAIRHLRGLGIPIPEDGKRIGTLRVAVSGSTGVKVLVRTTTSLPEGRAGLAYPGVGEHEGFEGAVYLCGLRQNQQDRSNVALQNMGAEGEITLRTTVFSGEAADMRGRRLDDQRLKPGGFYQFNAVLKELGSPAQGYVKVERVEGEAPFYAYGVINDQANSDGSFIFPVTAGSLEGKRGQTLPVIVETGEFTSELTVTNFSKEPRTLDLQFVSDPIKTDDKRVGFSMELEAGGQQIIPEVVEALRRQGGEGLGTSRGVYLGPLFVTAEEGDLSGIVIGARTGSEGENGKYSVFYNAVPFGEAFGQEAWVDGLQQNDRNRSNLALVNTGEVNDSPSIFEIDIYDGETGLLVETVTGRRLAPQHWHQVDGILGHYAPDSSQGYVRIRKVSGDNPFLAYGVVNDGAAPGERSGDGSYLPAQP